MTTGGTPQQKDSLPEGIARLTPVDADLSGNAEGLMAVWPTQVKRRPLGKRPVRPSSVDFEVSWFDGDTAFLFDDGTGDASDPVVGGLMAGTVDFHGGSYAVRWLSGAEFDAANRAMGEPF